MDFNIEIKKLKDGQEQILRLLKQSKTVKNELKVYTLDEIAKIFAVTKRTIYNWKEQGKLSCIIIGSKTYVTKSQLIQFLHTHEVKSINIGGH